MYRCVSFFLFFFFNDTATTEIYTLSLHDALPISVGKVERRRLPGRVAHQNDRVGLVVKHEPDAVDRKSTRLNSSHSQISYAVFCLKKKKEYCRFLKVIGQDDNC